MSTFDDEQIYSSEQQAVSLEQLQISWKNYKASLQPLIQENAYKNKSSLDNIRKNLYEQLRICIIRGREIQDNFQRIQLQWMAREIGDYIFKLFREYAETLIEPYLVDDNFKNFIVPSQRNEYFTNREQQLQEIHQSFTGSHNQTGIRKVALCGMGGIGKTQIAIEYSYRYRYDYSSIYWLQADDRYLFLLSIIELAEILIPDECEHEEQEAIVNALKNYFEQQSGWLLIVDNADEPSILRDYLPASGNGCILLTTRSSEVDPSIQQIEVPPFSEEASLRFLLRRGMKLLPHLKLEQLEPSLLQVSKELVKELGSLPLLLDQAGTYIKSNFISKTKSNLEGFKSYLTHYRQAGEQLRQIRGELSGNHNSVTTTYSLALEQVANKDSAAADLIRACSYLSPEVIPKRIFTENPDIWGHPLADRLKKSSGFDEVIKSATRYSLLQWEADNEILKIHPVVQQVIRDGLDAKEDKQWIEKTVAAVNSIFPKDMDIRFGSRELWRTCERFLPQAMKAIEWIERSALEKPEVGVLMNKVGTYLFLRSYYNEAEKIYEKALNLREELRNKLESQENVRQYILDVAESKNNLAELYFNQARYPQVEALLNQALKIEQDPSPLDYLFIARIINNIARLYTKKGQYQNSKEEYLEAEKQYQESLQINSKEENFAINRLTRLYQAKNYHDLANLYFLQGKYTEAEDKYHQALKINTEILGEEHRYVANNLNNLGDVYQAQASYDKAKATYEQALNLRINYLGENHLSVADSYARLARLYQGLEDYEKAKSFHQQALQLRESVLKRNHPDIASSYNDLGLFYQARGDYNQAELHYQKALEMYKDTLGEKHPQVADCLNNLALLYIEKEMYYFAREQLIKALQIYKKSFGRKHPKMAECFNSLAECHRYYSYYDKARFWYEKALQIRIGIFGENYRDVALNYNNLALCYHENEQYEEAERLYNKAIKLIKDAVEKQAPYLEVCLDNLAVLYQEQGRLQEAESLLQQVLNLKRQFLGEEDLEVPEDP